MSSASVQDRSRSRSRSPLRLQPLSETARLALDVVCKHDADPRIEAMRATIVRQQQELAAKDAEIARLVAGGGAVGPVLLANQESRRGRPADEENRARYLAKTETVAQWVERIGDLGFDIWREAM